MAAPSNQQAGACDAPERDEKKPTDISLTFNFNFPAPAFPPYFS